MGYNVANAGDVNGDGFDDFIVSSPFANVGATVDAGRSYVVFGKSGGLINNTNINLSAVANGSGGFVINGQAHGKERGTTVCQLHMFKFEDGETLTLEPWRAKAFPVLRDLMVDRSAFDRIQQAGGYNSTNVGNAPDANSILVGREAASAAFDAATCIGCGACVAACPNASALLFTSAKVGHLAVIPQGQPERQKRALAMVTQHDHEGFGACTNTLECEAACPKEISTAWIQRLNREYLAAVATSEERL
jgi:succinate dehydrogenase / fumarate reductase iron-sulfur subunit